MAARILLVDDDELTLRGIARMLQGAATVIATTRPREALDRVVAGEAYELIISDVEMPELRGTELISRVREAGIGIPSLLITAGHLPRDAGRVLAKPFTRDVLLAVIAELGLDLRR